MVARLLPSFAGIVGRALGGFFDSKDCRFRAHGRFSGNWLRAGCSVKRAQVAEWLMAADCKSAAPCELRRFESSPVHQVFTGPPTRAAFARGGVVGMNRLWVALGAYAVLAILAAATIADQKFKLATLAVLAMFAIRTLSWSRKLDRERRDRHNGE